MCPILDSELTIFGEREKNELQIKLECQGYRFLTNFSLNSGYEIDPERDENGYYNYKRYVYRIRDVPFTDSELVEKARDLGIFSEIRLGEAFDIYGKQLPQYKAVYVKGKKPLGSEL